MLESYGLAFSRRPGAKHIERERREPPEQAFSRFAASFQGRTGPSGVFAGTTFIRSSVMTPAFFESRSLLISCFVSADAAARERSRTRVDSGSRSPAPRSL